MAPYVVRVDADDFVNSNFLNFLSYYLDCNKQADAVACDYLLIDDLEIELRKCNCNLEPIACGIMFRRERLFDIGLYDEEFRFNEEKELRIRFENKYTIERLELPLYRYRRHEGNMTNNKKLSDKYYKNLNAKHGIRN